jgi:hypothetical protein
VKLKSLLYLNNFLLVKKRQLLLLLSFIFFITFLKSQTIANYITNGGFENYYSCGIALEKAKGWRSIDSSGSGSVLYCNTCLPNVPNNSYTYQWPHSGNSFVQTSFLCQPPQCSVYPNRGYFRNRLKANLVGGKTYCVKLYVNISDPSTYGISNIGLFFVDNSIDTITKIAAILSYISPQVENPSANILTDTMNWVAVTGTFVANGTEKNCIIGNFKSDAATTKTLINPTNLPTIGCDILIDDVSCIPLDLPAYAAAGSDIWAIPGNTIYLGRPQDVGIDEACEWFKLPNTTTVIANAAGLTLTVAITTNTYMVKQTICGLIKYDTVVVHASGLGLVSSSGVENSIKIYPNPASEILNVEFVTLSGVEASNTKIQIINSLGQIIREEEIDLKNNTALINTRQLANGVYVFALRQAQGDNSVKVNKRFVISR